MKMDVFTGKICAALEEKLDEGVHMEVRETRKNNGIILHGLMVSSKGQKVVPAVYLEDLLEAYESGASFDSIVCKLISLYKEAMLKGNIDMDFFRSYGAVKDGICYRLVGKKGNEAMLEEVPHVDFLDMAICFFYAYHGGGIGEGSIPIHNSHMEMWGACTEELFRLANENTPRIFPWKCTGMDELLNEMTGLGTDSGGPLAADEPAADKGKIPMKVLSNRKRIHGAACILYPGVLGEISGGEGNLFIIPSSVHELLLLPDDGTISAVALKEMIHEVNRTQVDPVDVLSDSLYYYDSAKKEVVIA